MAGGGGSSSTSQEQLVQYTNPNAVLLAAAYQSKAAEEARAAANQQLNQAINVMRQQYNTARADVQPYRTEGVQALNELNAYMGLQPYNPGTGPQKPIDPATYQATPTEIKEAIKNNLNYGFYGYDSNRYVTYDGPGSHYDGWSLQWAGGPPTNQMIVDYIGGPTTGKGYTERPGDDGGNFDLMSNIPWGAIGGSYKTVEGLYNDPAIRAAVAEDIRQKYADTHKEMYQTELHGYNRDLEEWQQNKDMYDKYMASGPYTPEQVMEKISTQPGYQFNLNQGLDALQRMAAAKGSLGSGRTLAALQEYGAGYASQEYGNTLSRLAALAGMGQQAATGTAGTSMGLGDNLAGLFSSKGDVDANSLLMAGQAKAQGLIDANQRFKKFTLNSTTTTDSGGGGFGEILGGIGQIAGMFSSKQYKTKGKKVKINIDKLDKLPVEKWKYKKSTKIDPSGQEHIGPYAEDFKKVFNVGDGKTIPIVSSIGILYQLVKQLNNKIESK